MNILKQIKQDQLAARKARDSFKASLLTTVIGEATMPGKDNNITKIITKFIKNSNEIINVGNTHQVIHAQNEIRILEQYVPKKLNVLELTGLIQSMSVYLDDMRIGTVMKELNKEYKDKFDAKMAVSIINSIT